MGGEAATLAKQHNIINNMMVTLPHAEQIDSKTLNLHQANLQKQKDFNTFNAFSTVHRFLQLSILIICILFHIFIYHPYSDFN